MAMKPKATETDRFWTNVLGYSWLGCWVASIWWEPYRWEFFWSGLFALFLCLLAAGAKDYTKPSTPTDSEKGG